MTPPPAHGAVRGALQGAGEFLLLLLGLAALWEAAIRLGGVRPFYLPPLAAVFGAFAVAPWAYAAGLGRTAAETVLGFAAGAVVGVGNGLLFLRAPMLRDMVFPIFVVSQTIPVIAFGALIVLWFGNTLFAKAAIAFYLTFFPMTVNALLGLQSVDARHVQLLRSFGATPGQVLWRLRLPAALPQVFVALRLAASLSLVGAIVGEWFGDTTGIGVLLLQAMFNEDVPGLWAAILCAALLGSGFYGLVALVERRAVFWGGES